jgi:hypothetical protein
MNTNPSHTVILDAEEKTTADGEFERFEALTSKLLRVPRRELDEQRERDEHRRGSGD